MDSIKISELLDEMGGRLPQEKIPNLIPVINRAIMILAKRLYIHESDLIKGELSIPVYASIDYTASTISFVSGGDSSPDTIIDSAEQFVIEGFAAGMPIYSNVTGNTLDVRIESVTARTITLREGDKVTVAAAGASVTLTSRADYGYLPDDFWGFISEPNISGYTNTIPKIPNREQEIVLSKAGAGLPRYHKLMGNRIYVFHKTSANTTICGEYFKKVTRLTKMDDYLPFAGLFDDVLQDYIIAILGGGPVETLKVAGMLTAAVDLVVSKREAKAIAGNEVDYNDLMEC